MNLDTDLTEVGIETQRGCVFQCEYCSYRTLSAPNALGPEDAAEVIFKTGVVRNASVNILDATASFPHERWKALLREIIARGGSPHPLWCFARVSDLNDESVSLMAAAGLRHVFVGQESGDQRILDLMKKGTRIKHVRPAVEALAKYGVSATFGFIHGFPGETPETMAATRRLIETLNQGFEDRPPIITYLLYPFGIPDLAAVSAREEFQNIDHFLDFEARGMDRMAREKTFGHVLETILAVSRIPHAPAYSHLLLKAVMPTSGISLFARHDRPALFRFLKAVERGMAIFLERELEGTPINDRELRSLKETILAGYPAGYRRPALGKRLLGKPVLDRLRKEWLAEPERGPGLLTRLVTSTTMWSQTHDFQLGWRAYRTGNPFAKPDAAPQCSGRVDVLATDLITHARATPNKYPKQALPARARG